MAPRTLSSSWKQFERLAISYFNGRKSKDEILQSINNCSMKANTAKINHAIKTIFLSPYKEMNEMQVAFFTSLDVEKVDDSNWAVNIDKEKNEMLFNPLGVFSFLKICEKAESNLATQEVRRSFTTYRHNAFLTELRKLPSKLVFFILILKEIAVYKGISRVEKKGGGIEIVSGEDYLNILWAFKEIEVFVQKTSGVNLRQEYALSWYESDWIIGQ